MLVPAPTALQSLPCPANTSVYGKTHTVAGSRPCTHGPVGCGGFGVSVGARVCAWGLCTHTGADARQAAAPWGHHAEFLFPSQVTCFDFDSSLSEAVEISSGLKSY